MSGERCSECGVSTGTHFSCRSERGMAERSAAFADAALANGKWVYPNIGQRPEGEEPARAYEYDEACQLLAEHRDELAMVKAERDDAIAFANSLANDLSAAKADRDSAMGGLQALRRYLDGLEDVHREEICEALSEVEFLTRELRRHDPRLVAARERNKP